MPKKLKKSKASHLAKYDRLRQESVKRTKEAQGWQAELWRYRWYLDEADVDKDTDLVKLWQVCYPSLPLTISLTYELSTSFLKEIGSGFPTIQQIALDILPVQASSVPCERLFSASKQTATDRHARLGSDRFEELQLMKFAWRGDLVDISVWNSEQIKVVEDKAKFAELLHDDEEYNWWDQEDNKFNKWV